MINAWFQRPDFSADDYEDVSCERVLEIWASVNVSDLDEWMCALMEKRKDFCPWGIGIGHNTNRWIHIYRETTLENTFCVLKEKKTPRKLLGFIPFKTTKSRHMDGVPFDHVPSLISEYFENVQGA